MEAIQTHPSTATQAKSFISPGSLSFPGGHNELTPPGDAGHKANGLPNGAANAGSPVNGNGLAPATPAATPGATGSQNPQGSGLTPTLQ